MWEKLCSLYDGYWLWSVPWGMLCSLLGNLYSLEKGLVYVHHVVNTNNLFVSEDISCLDRPSKPNGVLWVSQHAVDTKWMSTFDDVEMKCSLCPNLHVSFPFLRCPNNIAAPTSQEFSLMGSSLSCSVCSAYVSIYGFNRPIMGSSKMMWSEERIRVFLLFFFPFLGGANFLTICIDRFGTLSELFFLIENASHLCDLWTMKVISRDLIK